jgi:hypothetical protein
MKKTLALLLTALMLMLSLAVPVVAYDNAVPVYADISVNAEEETDCTPMPRIARFFLSLFILPVLIVITPIYWIIVYFGGVGEGANWFTHFFSTSWDTFRMPFRWTRSALNWMGNC